MPATPTPNAGLLQQAKNDLDWHIPLNANASLLDGLSAVGGLGCSAAEHPSSTLRVQVAPGVYLKQDATLGAFASPTLAAVPASSTRSLWLDTSGALQQGSSYPSTAVVRIATVTTSASAVTAIVDDRVVVGYSGTGALSFLPLAGGTMADGAAIVAGTSAGLSVASSAAQKLGFFGALPVVRPSGAGEAAVGALATGAAALASVGPTNSADQSATINSNEAALNAQLSNALADMTALKTLVNQLRADLVALGLIKGSS